MCLARVAAPMIWQWTQTRAAENNAALLTASLNVTHAEQDRLSAEIEGLYADSARLDIRLSEAEQEQARNQASARKLETLQTRLRGLLTDPNNRPQDDLPYVRVPK